MRREIITHRQIIELTRDVVRGFYNRTIDQHLEYLHDDFVWIGAFDFQFATSKEQFLSIIQSEMSSVPFIMSDEQFELITRDRDTFVLFCRFKLHATLDDGKVIHTSTRLSVIWRYVDGVIKLVHIHGSNAQDVPLSVTATLQPERDTSKDFFQYIQSSAKFETTPKVMFRITNGHHHIFPESEILYLETAGQHTMLYTKTGVFKISGILRTHQEKLSDTFLRIHKSYLVNKNYVTSLYRYRMSLSDDVELPVSKERYLSLKHVLRDGKQTGQDAKV